MASNSKEQLVVDSYLNKEPAIGRWLWALQDARQRTMRTLSGLSQAIIDWLPGDNESCIGTVLYHIADIEADWLYVEVLESPLTPDIAALFPFSTRDEQGDLTQVRGVSFEQHLNRLAIVRDLLLDVYQGMELQDFRRVRYLAQYDVTPEWVIHHLMQHEAEHRSQINGLRARAEHSLVK